MTYDDMSVKSCADRFNAKRKAILEHIRKGKVSASMSGIEYYPNDFHDLTMNDQIVIRVSLTWNGKEHIERPNWLEEYEAYKKGVAGMTTRTTTVSTPTETYTIKTQDIGRSTKQEVKVDKKDDGK